MKTLWVWKRQGAARPANPLLSLACVRRLLLASLVALGEESMPTTLPDLPTCGAQTAINNRTVVCARDLLLAPAVVCHCRTCRAAQVSSRGSQS